MITDKSIHLIGIGGAGMSGVASMLVKMGNNVSGSDIKQTAVTDRLVAEGIDVSFGHKAANINNPDMVIVSSVITKDNEEYLAAEALTAKEGFLLLKRAQALAMLTQGKEAIVVGGTHGKTSTTALIVSVLENGQLSPSYVVGGEFEETGMNSKLSGGDSFILEADESDGSIEYFSADIGVITNIEEDHLDYYGTLNRIEDIFKQFAENSNPKSCFYACIDDSAVCRVISGIDRKIVSFGVSKEADVRAENIEITNASSKFDFVYFGETIGRVVLNIPGVHNVLNALPALAIGYAKGVSFSAMQKAMQASYRVKRRLEVKYEDDRVLLIDDYAHHPTEITVTLQTLRAASNRRLIAVFQPHRYTRLKFLFDGFCNAFDDADIVVLADVYSASEAVIPDVSTEKLFETMRKVYPAKEIIYFKEQNQIINYLKETVQDNDIIAVLGAGDINDIVIPLKDFFSHQVAC